MTNHLAHVPASPEVVRHPDHDSSEVEHPAWLGIRQQLRDQGVGVAPSSRELHERAAAPHEANLP